MHCGPGDSVVIPNHASKKGRTQYLSSMEGFLIEVKVILSKKKINFLSHYEFENQLRTINNFIFRNYALNIFPKRGKLNNELLFIYYDKESYNQLHYLT